MNSFKRTGNSKESLNVGNAHHYEEMWTEKIYLSGHYHLFHDYEMNVIGGNRWDYKLLDKETGIVEWYTIDKATQNVEVVHQISMENLIPELDKISNEKEEKAAREAQQKAEALKELTAERIRQRNAEEDRGIWKPEVTQKLYDKIGELFVKKTGDELL